MSSRKDEFYYLTSENRWHEYDWQNVEENLLSKVLTAAKAYAETKTLKNGASIEERFLSPNEIDRVEGLSAEDIRNKKAATEIVVLGELEARVEGVPECYVVQLENRLAEIDSLLEQLEATPEITSGDQELSRRQVIKMYRSWREEAEKTLHVGLFEAKQEDPSGDSLEFWRETMAGVYLCGLEVGLSAQRASNKDDDRFVESGWKSYQGGKQQKWRAEEANKPFQAAFSYMEQQKKKRSKTGLVKLASEAISKNLAHQKISSGALAKRYQRHSKKT